MNIDLIPNGWRSTPTDALLWWLANPLLLHFFPCKMAATLAQVPHMTLPEQQRVLWAMRGMRARARATKPRPADVTGLTLDDLEALYAQAADNAERDDLRRFGRALHPMEYQWFADRIQLGLARRAAETLPA